jgi:predicted transcriptional regulator
MVLYNLGANVSVYHKWILLLERITMSKSLIEIAADIVKAQAAHRAIETDEMQHLMCVAYNTMVKMQRNDGLKDDVPNSLDSIGEKAIKCLECGKSFKQLSYRHLAEHGITAKAYKAKYGLPASKGLVAHKVSAERGEKIRVGRMSGGKKRGGNDGGNGH